MLKRTTPINRRDYQFTPDEIAKLIPQIGDYIIGTPTWSDIVDIAERWTRRSVGIDQTLWKKACQVMGREWAAVAVGLIATRSSNYFIVSPAAYLQGMITRYQNGTLNLGKSIIRLKTSIHKKKSDSTILLNSMRTHTQYK